VLVDGYLALQAHNDALFRELELIGIELESGAAAARSYLELLERADELCRSGVLLTPEPSAEVKALRRWFVEEMAAQL
jgi:hypothetical protein